MRGETKTWVVPGPAAGDGGGDRFEFRIFRRRLGPEATVLAAIAGAGRLEVSCDRYVLVPGRMDVGLKIRGGRVELKRLRRIVAGLEQWHPEAGVGLPAAGRDLAPLLGAVDLPCPHAEQVFADGSELAHWLAHGRGVSDASLRKRRRFLLLADARAELGDILWNRARLGTLAVESVDADVVAALVTRLGLTGATNTSYPLLLSGGLSRR